METLRGIVAVAALGTVGFVLTGQTANPPVVTGNAKVDQLLSQLTLEEKINRIHGGPEAVPSGVGQAGAWPGVPRLGIPSLHFTDGPPGISVNMVHRDDVHNGTGGDVEPRRCPQERHRDRA